MPEIYELFDDWYEYEYSDEEDMYGWINEIHPYTFEILRSYSLETMLIY